MNIYIVEDDELLSMMLERMIIKMGYSVVGKSQTGTDAITSILSIDPDLVLMDINLKDEIDGIQVVETIKKNKEYPIIYITGNSESVIRNRADQFGYHDFIVKPASFDVLQESISKVRNGS